MFKGRALLLLLTVAITTLLGATESKAIPSFSRKYNTSCQTCHTAFPVLNSFGEAFRRNGYRFPSTAGSEDSDAASEATVPLGENEHAQSFPRSVWPDRISQNPPLSLLVYGTGDYVTPRSDLYKSTQNNWRWDRVVQSVSLLAAGSFSDRLSYYAKATFSTSARIAAAYVIWNDLIGPRHLVNLSVGRLAAPQLTSFASTDSYINYQLFPAVSVAGLFNPNASFVVGQGPADGAEVHGVAFHRVGYSFGAIASQAPTGANMPNSEDFYMRIGAKFGGMSLDGEGASAINVDPARPWAETSLTVDTFGYRGVLLTDNGINSPAITPQRSAFAAVGHALRLNLQSLTLSAIVQYQKHHRPYPGTAPATPRNAPAALPGVPDNTKGRGIVASGELAYVVFPWLTPAFRAEYTRLDSDWGEGSLLRLLPGVSVLIRPNLRFYVVGDIQRANGLPPMQPGSFSWWTRATGSVQPNPGQTTQLQVEKISAVVSWAL